MDLGLHTAQDSESESLIAQGKMIEIGIGTNARFDTDSDPDAALDIRQTFLPIATTLAGGLNSLSLAPDLALLGPIRIRNLSRAESKDPQSEIE